MNYNEQFGKVHMKMSVKIVASQNVCNKIEIGFTFSLPYKCKSVFFFYEDGYDKH